MGRRLAVIIGVNQYRDSTFQPLHYAETDARALAQWLVNVQGGKWNPPDVQLILGSLATKELVESLITQACVNMAGPDDLVFIYFAGHAFLDERQGEGYLALANTQYLQPETGIQINALVQKAVARSRAANVLVMFDHFQSGRLWSSRRATPYDSKPMLGPQLLQAVNQHPDRIFFCSCRGNEIARETGEKNLGLLVHHMILGLCGPARDKETGLITLQKLQAYLFKVLPEPQRPQIFGQEQSQIVLVGDPDLTKPASPPSQPLPGFPSGITRMNTAEGTQTGGNRAATATAQMSPTPQTQGQTPEQQQAAALLKQARYLLQMQNPAEALRLCTQAIQFDPANLDALILKGQLLGASGRFPEAVSLIDQAMQINPNNPLAWSMKAALLTNMGKYQEALIAADRSLAIDPGNPETNEIKATIMARLIESTGEASNKGLKSSTRFESKRPVSHLGKWLGLEVVGLIMILVGFAMLAASAKILSIPGLAVASFGVGLMMVNAWSGTSKAGFKRFLLVVVISLILGGLPVVVFVGMGMTRLSAQLGAHPSLLLPLVTLVLLLLLAAVLPALAGLSGLMMGSRNRKVA